MSAFAFAAAHGLLLDGLYRAARGLVQRHFCHTHLCKRSAAELRKKPCIASRPPCARRGRLLLPPLRRFVRKQFHVRLQHLRGRGHGRMRELLLCCNEPSQFQRGLLGIATAASIPAAVASPAAVGASPAITWVPTSVADTPTVAPAPPRGCGGARRALPAAPTGRRPVSPGDVDPTILADRHLVGFRAHDHLLGSHLCVLPHPSPPSPPPQPTQRARAVGRRCRRRSAARPQRADEVDDLAAPRARR